MDQIELNPRIEGEIRHQSIANGLQDFQFVTDPLLMDYKIFNLSPIRLPSVQLKIRRSDRLILQINRFFVYP